MPFNDTPEGTTHYCTHENQNEAGLCQACLGVNPLTTLISEQNRHFSDLMSSNIPLYQQREIMEDWHTTSIIKILEAIVGEMKKTKRIGTQGTDCDCSMEGGCGCKILDYNDGIETQINNLTAVIESLK